MTKLTIYLDPEHKAVLRKLAVSVDLVAKAGAGAGELGSISLLFKRIAQAVESDPERTMHLIKSLLQLSHKP